MTSLLEGEVITPRLGGRIDMLLMYRQSFSSLKNGPGWEVTFQFEKWPNILDGQSFSSLENCPRWEITFQFGKWPKIFYGQSFSSSKNGSDRTIIFIMKMVQ
jgi:hypothetical protein